MPLPHPRHPDQHAGKANQSGEGRGDKPSKGKPGKGKNK
jgi:hypothetical protein